MVNQAKILEGKELRSRSWVDVQIWEWEVPGLLPALDLCLDFGSPQQIGPLWSGGSLFLNGHVHVRTAAVVLGAISTEDMLASSSGNVHQDIRLLVNLPLGKILVTTDMSTLTRLTTLARFSMARSISVTEGTVDVEDATHLRRGGPPPGPAIATRLMKKMKKEDDEA